MTALPDTAVTADIARHAIASALSTAPRTVTVHQLSCNERGTAVHCRAEAEGTQLFAKILTSDRYPAWEPVTMPSPGMYANDEETRLASDQIEHEWSMGHRLSSMHAPITILRPLGRCLETRSIVWELADGLTAREILARAPLNRSMRTAGEEALECTGIWLRRLHDSHETGRRVLDLDDTCSSLRAVEPVSTHNARYLSRALELLETARGALAGMEITVPVSLTHGDLSLHNVIHDTDTGVTTLVDLEHVGVRPVLHDLVILSANTRGKMLNPLASYETARAWEESFWKGYGDTAPELRTAATALAGAWIFYWMLGRSPAQGAASRAYRSLLQGIYSRRALRRMRQEISCFSERLDDEEPTAPSAP